MWYIYLFISVCETEERLVDLDVAATAWVGLLCMGHTLRILYLRIIYYNKDKQRKSIK